MNVTTALFLGEPAPLGYDFSLDTIATTYITPNVRMSNAPLQIHRSLMHLIFRPCRRRCQVATLLGQVMGRYLNDYFMFRTLRRNNGVFEAETRLM